jgi:hypothetical protein
MWQKPTPIEEFEARTSLVMQVLVDQMLAEYPVNLLTWEERAWFTNNCERWFCRFHANSSAWKEWLENKVLNIDPRDQCKVWIRHWLEAYLRWPEGYKRKVEEYACGGSAMQILPTISERPGQGTDL